MRRMPAARPVVRLLSACLRWQAPRRLLVVGGVLLAGLPAGQAAFTIQINPGAGLASNTAALAAFQRAAEEWSSRIANDVTVYVDADLSGGFSNPNTIGGASPTTYQPDVSDLNLGYTTVVRPALVAHGAATGNTVLNYLPGSLTGLATAPDGSTILTDTVGILRANQRVLGLLDASDTRADGVITFNAAFSFDYDRFDADGVAAGLMDFQTVAAHELGHILGFLSDVDEFDQGYLETNLTTLDLFRFAAVNAPGTLSEFETFQREMRPGVESVLSDTLSAIALSTGSSTGDGWQASHWKDDGITGQLLGLMDPNLDTGTFRAVGAADLRALELIGYTMVPEPGRGVLLLMGICCTLLRRRR